LKSTSTVNVNPYYPRKRYAFTCKDNKHALFGSYGTKGAVAYCKDGDYYIDQTNIGVTAPECVGYAMSTMSENCTVGSQKFMIDDWFEGTYQYCAECVTGTFYNTTSKSCELCRAGTYQDEQGKTSCELCDRGTWTTHVGTKDASNCIDLCKPGSYSESGMNEPNQPCTKCPRGMYSYLNGTKACISCDDKATTLKEGSTGPDDCYRPLQITQTNPDKVTAGYVGSNIEVQCFFEGLPAPSIKWSKTNGDLPNDHYISNIYDLNVNLIGSSLTLRKVTAADIGDYKCSIKNSLGHDEKTIKVGVIPKFVQNGN